MTTTTATTATTTTAGYMAYVELGDEIAEAHERLVSEWMDKAPAGKRGSQGGYIAAHGPRALPADWRGYQVPVYILQRARVRARALIRTASQERHRQGLAAKPMGDRETRARVLAITPRGAVYSARTGRRFTPEQVRFIRREYRPGRGSPTSAYGLGQLFGVSPGVIYQVVARQTYADIPEEDLD